MGLVIGVLLAAAAAYLAWMNFDAYFSIKISPQYALEDVPAWVVLFSGAIVVALWAAVGAVRQRRAFRQRLAEREADLRDAREQLTATQANLQAYEDKIHDFALKVVALSQRQITAADEEPMVEVAPELALAAESTLEEVLGGDEPTEDEQPPLTETSDEPAAAPPPEERSGDDSADSADDDDDVPDGELLPDWDEEGDEAARNASG